MPELDGSQSQKNLRHAFSCEAESIRRLLSLARQVDLLGDVEAATTLAQTAEEANHHAQALLDKLGELPKDAPVATLLEAAVAGEQLSAAARYESMAAAARDEGLEELVGWFGELARAKREAAARLQRLRDARAAT